MKIVLFGSIPKGDHVRKDWTDWEIASMKAIKKIIPSVIFIHGDAISHNAGPEMIVGHDLTKIKQADVCVIDVHEKIGAGTAQEVVITKILKSQSLSSYPRTLII